MRKINFAFFLLQVSLPFMDPSQADGTGVDKLPSVFIAPLGYKAPKGYKGHPLPYDPEPSDPVFETTNQVTLVTGNEIGQTPNYKTRNNPFLRTSKGSNRSGH